jgi:hypothetical protein
MPASASWISRRFSTSASSARIPATFSPLPSSTGTVTTASAGTSAAALQAPAMSRRALTEAEPCHCGTDSTVVTWRQYETPIAKIHIIFAIPS